MPATQESALREEIAKLGEMLGETIRDIVGADSLCVVEDIRRLAWNRRSGQAEAARELDRLIVSLNNEQLRVVIRAFSIFLDLANLAEDRQRVRVLRERREQAFPDSIGESIPGAISQLKLAGRSAAEIQTLLDQLQIELVFTAHPTEAKRRSVRSKLRKIRQLLDAVDAERNRRLHDSADEQIRAELAKLWQTDVIRPWRPSVMQEVRRGLSMKPVLWNVIPTILRDFRLALAEEYPDDYLSVRPCVTFGSWIGGDRDGHPFVTPEVSEQTIIWLREAALELHLSACSELFESLSLSERQVPLAASLAKGVSAACDRWPQLEREVREIPPNEVCRRWLGMIHWRLRQTQSVNLVDADIAGMYASASELEADVTALLQSLDTAPCGQFLTGEVQTWLDQILTFGFHLARLDVRQDARQYRTIADELLRSCGLCVDPTVLSENERLGLLVDTLEKRVKFASDKLSNEARQAIALFQLLHRIMANFGPQALGGHVISMTHAPSDVMTVLWLWVQTTPEAVGELPDTNRSVLPIIPLFETITDLKKGPEILEGMFQIPAYREYVRQQADRQTVMLGYSDSTKDGGYLSACWSLFQAQQQLQEVAAKYEIALTFFHGRGGSLGRGEALPREASFHFRQGHSTVRCG